MTEHQPPPSTPPRPRPRPNATFAFADAATDIDALVSIWAAASDASVPRAPQWELSLSVASREEILARGYKSHPGAIGGELDVEGKKAFTVKAVVSSQEAQRVGTEVLPGGVVGYVQIEPPQKHATQEMDQGGSGSGGETGAPAPATAPQDAFTEMVVKMTGALSKRHIEQARGLPHWYVTRLFVHPAYWNCGIARRLLDAAIELYQSRAASSSMASTTRMYLESTPMAEPMYAKMGFVELGRDSVHLKHTDRTLNWVYMGRNWDSA